MKTFAHVNASGVIQAIVTLDAPDGVRAGLSGRPRPGDSRGRFARSQQCGGERRERARNPQTPQACANVAAASQVYESVTSGD